MAKVKKIKIDFDMIGVLKTLPPDSFSKLISIVCIFHYVCSTNNFSSRSFGLW